MAVYQIFVKLLDGRTQCLQISTPTISGETLKTHLFAKTRIPLLCQRLVTGSRVVSNETLISASADGLFPSCVLLLRLPGGKGGFGSLLRGAATKAGQKKTNNFDACRDMSGRRLRHVNAEKKLEEWKSEAEDRRLEKLADQFLKKKAKENKKNSSVDVNKFLMKYREDSDKCMEEVEESVRQSFGVYKELKRKIRPASDSSSKRVKIWLGKNKVEESSSEEDDDVDNNDDTEKKSVVLDDGNSPRQIKEVKGSSSMVVSSGIDSDASSSMVASSGIGSDGEISGGTSDQSNLGQAKGSILDDVSSLKSSELSSFEEAHETVEILLPDQSSRDKESNFDLVPDSNVVKAPENVELKLDLHGQIESELCDETIAQSADNSSLEEPLNFDKYNSPAELEVLGMDRLKAELQARGLKCGGTLPERASRLYLLKTTPFDKLPKKFLAKPPK